MAKGSTKQPPHERRLRDSVIFQGPNFELVPLNAPWPWPEAGDILLRPPVGDEEFVYGLERWVVDDLSRLGHYANQYRNTARELVAVWLYGHRNPEAFAYTIGHLYRHAIELQLKAMMAHDPAFRSANGTKQFKKMKGHGLERLWQRIKKLYADVAEPLPTKIVEQNLRMLDAVDENSEGFRYPFRFVADTNGKVTVRVGTMGAMSSMSFDNFVWVLDSIYNWLSTTEDAFIRLQEHEQEMAAAVQGA